MAVMASNERGDIVTAEGYALSPFLLRLASAAIDAAFLIAGFWAIFFFSYLCTWYPTLREGLGIGETSQRIYEYQKASQLLNVAEDGSLSDIKPSEYTGYETAIKGYYFIYNALDNPVNPAPHGYSIDEYNVAVCNLPKDTSIRNDSLYYDFATDEQGNPIMGQEAVLKPSLFDETGHLTLKAREDLFSYYRTKYYATQDLLLAEPYYKQGTDSIFYAMLLIEAISIFPPFLAFYVIIPSVSPYSRTLGKRWMHLMVIDVSGKPLPKPFLALRSIPFVLTVVAAAFLNEVIYSIGLGVLVFLVSWGCASFTKRKRALHDFCAHSVVTREDDAFRSDIVIEAEEKHD